MQCKSNNVNKIQDRLALVQLLKHTLNNITMRCHSLYAVLF